MCDVIYGHPLSTFGLGFVYVHCLWLISVFLSSSNEFRHLKIHWSRNKPVFKSAFSPFSMQVAQSETLAWDILKSEFRLWWFITMILFRRLHLKQLGLENPPRMMILTVLQVYPSSLWSIDKDPFLWSKKKYLIARSFRQNWQNILK